NHLSCLPKSSVSGLSMSMTVERFTRSIARVEYSIIEFANKRNRPRLSIGAATSPVPARATHFTISRRVMPIGFVLLFSLFGSIKRFPPSTSSLTLVLAREPGDPDEQRFVTVHLLLRLRRSLTDIECLQNSSPVHHKSLYQLLYSDRKWLYQ